MKVDLRSAAASRGRVRRKRHVSARRALNRLISRRSLAAVATLGPLFVRRRVAAR